LSVFTGSVHFPEVCFGEIRAFPQLFCHQTFFGETAGSAQCVPEDGLPDDGYRNIFPESSNLIDFSIPINWSTESCFSS